ncbi:MAG: DUF4271 domain-containing protein [Bacteroidota bacterium]
MIKDSLSTNPASVPNNSMSWFRNFLLIQDEVPAGINGIIDNQPFSKSRIVQVKMEKPESFEKSLFASHQLKASSPEAKERGMMNPEWIAPVILFCFVLLATARYGWHKRMIQIFKAFFVGRLFVQLAREGGLFNERVTLFLFSSYIISFTLFLFQIINFYIGTPSSSTSSLIFFLQLLAGVSLFYIFKIALFRFSGYVFKSVKEISNYVLTIFVFGQIAGILILPFLVLLTYTKNEINIAAGSILFSMLYVYRFFRGAVTVTSSSKISTYYIFLYLCTLEILPLLIIAKKLLM